MRRALQTLPSTLQERRTLDRHALCVRTCTTLASAAMSTAVASGSPPGAGAGESTPAGGAMPAAARRAVYSTTGKLVIALSAPYTLRRSGGTRTHPPPRSGA